MRARTLALVAALGSLLAVPAPSSYAFNSLDSAGGEPHGRAAARTTYNSEHRQYMLNTLLDGIGTGVGSQINQSYQVLVPTVHTDYADLGNPANPSDPNDPWTLNPAHPTEVERLRLREVSNGSMYTELPDFSYTLYDWWSGNETCPPSVPGAVNDGNVLDECYEFAGWMGALNSTHFAPQARTNWLHYHEVAMGVGDQCQAYKAAMGYGSSATGFDPYLNNTLDCGIDGLCPGDDGYPGADTGEGDGVDDFLEQCELITYWLESIGHHYLQDSWSSGHMWQRWGGPTPALLTTLERGLAVAMTSGTIHGTASVTGSHDRMCSGGGFRYSLGAGHGNPTPDDAPIYDGPLPSTDYWIFHDALGDHHYTDIQSGGGWIWSGPFPHHHDTNYQYDKMIDCASASVRQMYGAGAQIYGAPAGWSGSPSNPRSGWCFDQRAINEEMYDGSWFDYGRVSLPLDSGAVYSGIVYNAGLGVTDSAVLLWELTRISSRLSRADTWDADGWDGSTNTGRYALGNMMGVASNELNNSVPPWTDPPAPWDGVDATGAGDPREEILLNAFHRGLAPYWCDNLDKGDLNVLRNQCQNAADPLTQEAACQTCEEFSARHIRIGCSDSDYEEDREPLCNYISEAPDDVDYLYLDMDPDVPEAQDAGLAAAEFCRSTNPQFGPCVEAYFFGDYDITYCTAFYYPFFQCLGCSSCFPIATAMAVIESPYAEEDLNILWNNAYGGYYNNPTSATTTFVHNPPLTPWTCGVTVTGYANIEVQVCDPYYSACTTAYDAGQSTCYGSY